MKTELTNNTKSKIVYQDNDDFHVISENEIDDLKKYADIWNDLSYESPQKLLSLSYAWNYAHLKNRLNPGSDFFCLFAFQNDSLIGVLPVIVSPHKLLGKMCPQLSTPYLSDFIIDVNHYDKILKGFILSLNHIVPGWFRLKIDRISEESSSLLMKDKNYGFCKIMIQHNGFGSIMHVNKSHEDFMSDLSRKFKKRLRYINKKLNEKHQIEFIESNNNHLDYMSKFMEIEASGIKKLDGAIINDKSKVEEYKTLIDNLLGKDWLYWYILKANNNIIAINMTFHFNNAIIINKMCYDENYADYSPGTVLLERSFEQIYKSQAVEQVNFLTDLPWNKRWRMDKLEYFNMSIYPNKVIPYIVDYIPRAVYQIIKKSRAFIFIWKNILRR